MESISNNTLLDRIRSILLDTFYIRVNVTRYVSCTKKSEHLGVIHLIIYSMSTLFVQFQITGFSLLVPLPFLTLNSEF